MPGCTVCPLCADGKAETADAELDALLEEVGGDSPEFAAAQETAPAEQTSPQPASKSKKKKKKGKGGAKDEEDLDAVLAELGMAPAAKPEAERTTDAQAQPSGAEAAGEPAAEAAGAAAENDEDAAADGDGKVSMRSWSRQMMTGSS